jgi:heterotetrameric sarcosine oxidase gamma subunit
VRDLLHESVFAGLCPIGGGEGVVAIERVGLTIATVLLRHGKLSELLAAVENNFNIALPVGAKWTAHNGVAFLGTGPGKWLAISESNDPAFVRGLETQLQGRASVVEQSGGLGVLRLSGSALLDTLEKGVQIDLAPEAFPAGSVAVTSIAHIGATLWKVDDGPTIDIAVARSLAGSFRHWLAASAAAYGLSVQRPQD